MRDPDLIVRAQLAASALEGAWHRWRDVHGHAAYPMPAVSSYVGYSLEEPWGEPRVVFGLAAQDAEQLAGLLQRHDCVGPVYARAAAATMEGTRDLPAGAPPEPLPVPRQGPPANLSAECDEPLYRQAAAAVRAAAAARLSERQEEEAAGTEPASDVPAEADAPDDTDAEDLLSTGAPSRAASEALSEVEADSKAAQTDQVEAAPDEVSVEVGVEVGGPRRDGAGHDGPGDGAPGDDGAGDDADSGAAIEPEVDDAIAPDSEVGIEPDVSIAEPTGRAGAERETEPDQPAMPQIYATDVLEPLPDLSPEAAAEPLPEPAAKPLPEPVAEPSPEPAVKPLPEPVAEPPPRPDPRPEVASGAYYEPGEESELEVDQDPRPADQSEADPSAVGRRGKTTRSYPMPRVSRTKRPAHRANG